MAPPVSSLSSSRLSRRPSILSPQLPSPAEERSPQSRPANPPPRRPFSRYAPPQAPASPAGRTGWWHYATVGEKICEMTLVKSGLAYCDVEVDTGGQPPRGEIVNVM